MAAAPLDRRHGVDAVELLARRAFGARRLAAYFGGGNAACAAASRSPSCRSCVLTANIDLTIRALLNGHQMAFVPWAQVGEMCRSQGPRAFYKRRRAGPWAGRRYLPPLRLRRQLNQDHRVAQVAHRCATAGSNRSPASGRPPRPRPPPLCPCAWVNAARRAPVGAHVGVSCSDGGSVTRSAASHAALLVDPHRDHRHLEWLGLSSTIYELVTGRSSCCPSRCASSAR